jgi:TolB-like protein
MQGPRTHDLGYVSVNLPVPVREIGEKLSVDTVLEGSVQVAGERLRITANLIKISDGFHLWSQTYDRTADASLPSRMKLL